MDSYLLGTLIRISCEINRMIQTVCRICAEPQQILPTAENEGKFKIIFKEEVSCHRSLRARLWTPSVGSERWRQTSPFPAASQFSAQVHGLLLLGFGNIQWKGRAGPVVCSDPCRLLPAQSTQGEVHTPVLTRGPIPVGR